MSIDNIYSPLVYHPLAVATRGQCWWIMQHHSGSMYLVWQLETRQPLSQLQFACLPVRLLKKCLQSRGWTALSLLNLRICSPGSSLTARQYGTCFVGWALTDRNLKCIAKISWYVRSALSCMLQTSVNFYLFIYFLFYFFFLGGGKSTVSVWCCLDLTNNQSFLIDE